MPLTPLEISEEKMIGAFLAAELLTSVSRMSRSFFKRVDSLWGQCPLLYFVAKVWILPKTVS
jgi:hypothetical protein